MAELATIIFDNGSDTGVSFLTHRSISVNVMAGAKYVMELNPALDTEVKEYYISFYDRLALTMNVALELGGAFTVTYNIPSDWGQTDSVPEMSGASASANGKHGLVPQPMAGDNNKFLKGDGTWGTMESGVTEYDALINKPSVNGHTLSGNKTGEDLGLVDASSIGTAAMKNSTSSVIAGSTDLVESGAVKTEIDSAVSRTYRHAGTKTVAELTSSLLIAANDGNVYNITDSGTTTEDFLEGAGKPIRVGDNVGVAKDGNAYKFDLLSGFIDTSNFVTKSSTSGLIKNDGSIDTNTYLTQHQDISGKADKVSSATNNNFAALDANGNIKDSGHKHSDYLTQHQDISGKADKVSGATSGDVATLDGNGNLVDSGKTLGVSVPFDAEFTDTQSDWSQSTSTEKDYIKNKPTLGTASAKDVPESGNASSAQVVMGSDTRLTDSRPASDVSEWAKASTKPSYTASEVGAIATTAKGANGGVAELDSSGKLPSSQLPLGETLSTAYRGDRGKIAYDHSQTISGNPHNVTKSDVGLGNVGNFKAVSTDASQGLTDTEKANARTNIGAGTSSFSGSYNDLTDQPTIPDVSGKADKVSNATSGDVATLNESGNLADSGILYSNIIQKSSTSGLVKNDGTVDTTTYVKASEMSVISDADIIAAVNTAFGVTDT